MEHLKFMCRVWSGKGAYLWNYSTGLTFNFFFFSQITHFAAACAVGTSCTAVLLSPSSLGLEKEICLACRREGECR